ncbi:MAG: CHAP domain-containing protein [Candidatus Dormibacteria bacterium]
MTMMRLGAVDVEVRDGFVVAARDGSGNSWSAAARTPFPRLVTHAMVMAAIAVPFMVTAASAHTPGPVRPARIALVAVDVAAEKERRVTPQVVAATAAVAPAAPVPAAPPVDPQRPNPDRAPVVGGGGHFSWGWCTWYVSTKRFVPWMGNAIEWYANAAAMGYPEGLVPKAGAIMVTRESGWGHVAYVESVDPDGRGWTVSEMNFRGFGVVSTRHLTIGQGRVVGFIY